MSSDGDSGYRGNTVGLETAKDYLWEVKAEAASILVDRALATDPPHWGVRGLWNVGTFRKYRKRSETIPMPLRRRLWLWLRGFDERPTVFYDFEEYHPSLYLSEYERRLTMRIAGDWGHGMYNKLAFHRLMEPFPERRFAVHGTVDDGRFYPLVDAETPPGTADAESASTSGVETADGGTRIDREVGESSERETDRPLGPDGESATERAVEPAAERLADLLRHEGQLVLKPVYGADGKGVFLLARDDGEYRIDGESCPPERFRQVVSDLEGYLVCEFAEQGDYADRLYPDSTNTIRLLTMWDYEEETPFVSMAVQRIGNDDSAPLDNFSRGGLSAEIDLDTGTLGPAVRSPDGTRLEWYDRHPDTDAPIAGVEIPNWEGVRGAALEMAAAFPFVPYVGWDLLVDEDGGVTVIEANEWSDLDLLQVHRPLLLDSRTRRFFREHNVIDR